MGSVRKFLVFALLVLFIPGVHSEAAQPQLPLFSTEQAAQQHCPADIVVWLNIPSGIYHFKGQRWYGQTKKALLFARRKRIRLATALHVMASRRPTVDWKAATKLAFGTALWFVAPPSPILTEEESTAPPSKAIEPQREVKRGMKP